jgi:hypothetical protein
VDGRNDGCREPRRTLHRLASSCIVLRWRRM